jgi:hypothetical protein
MILILDNLFYTLNHILSVMIESVSLYASHMKWLPNFQRKILPPCYHEDGGSVLLRNVGTYVPNYTKSQLS